MIPRFLLALCAASCALPAAAIIIRPDRDDAEYLELSSKYPSAVRLGDAGEGVLVAPRFILTSASVASKLRGARTAKVAVAGRAFEIQEVFIQEVLGLVVLKSDATHVPFTRLFQGDNEQGQTMVVVGHGGDGRKRASINTVDRMTPQTLGMRIKGADEASDLQGSLTPAELGAPLYVQVSDGLAVAGIATATDGTWETYARVSAYSLWIESSMVEVGRKEAEALLSGRGS